MLWIENPNDGYYWTLVPGHTNELEIVRFSGGRYCCIASAHLHERRTGQLFFGPIAKPETISFPLFDTMPSEEYERHYRRRNHTPDASVGQPPERENYLSGDFP
jgi:hypothetical protein